MDKDYILLYKLGCIVAIDDVTTLDVFTSGKFFLQTRLITTGRLLELVENNWEKYHFDILSQLLRFEKPTLRSDAYIRPFYTYGNTTYGNSSVNVFPYTEPFKLIIYYGSMDYLESVRREKIIYKRRLVQDYSTQLAIARVIEL